MEQKLSKKSVKLEQYSVMREDVLTAKKEKKGFLPQGSIYFQLRKPGKKKPFRSLRIRKFYIQKPKLKRTMVFVCHPKGVHLLDQAILHSEAGCRSCKIYLEKQLF